MLKIGRQIIQGSRGFHRLFMTFPGTDMQLQLDQKKQKMKKFEGRNKTRKNIIYRYLNTILIYNFRFMPT